MPLGVVRPGDPGEPEREARGRAAVEAGEGGVENLHLLVDHGLRDVPDPVRMDDVEVDRDAGLEGLTALPFALAGRSSTTWFSAGSRWMSPRAADACEPRPLSPSKMPTSQDDAAVSVPAAAGVTVAAAYTPTTSASNAASRQAQAAAVLSVSLISIDPVEKKGSADPPEPEPRAAIPLRGHARLPRRADTQGNPHSPTPQEATLLGSLQLRD